MKPAKDLEVTANISSCLNPDMIITVRIITCIYYILLYTILFIPHVSLHQVSLVCLQLLESVYFYMIGIHNLIKVCTKSGDYMIVIVEAYRDINTRVTHEILK